MFEILSIYKLCQLNASNAKMRGKQPGQYILITIFLWLTFEILFFEVGFANHLHILIAYLFGLLGGVIGGFFSYFIAKASDDEHMEASPVLFHKTSTRLKESKWIFACYDYNHVAGNAISGDTSYYYSENYAMETIRNRFSLPSNQYMRYVRPDEWEAPTVTATENSFLMDEDIIHQRIEKFLYRRGYNPVDIVYALSSVYLAPIPNHGILLIFLDMERTLEDSKQPKMKSVS